MKSRITAVALGIATTAVSFAGTLTADFSTTHGLKNVDFTWTYNGGETKSVNTAEIVGSRTDTPGVGVDAFVPMSFSAFCVEVGQNITVPQNHTYDDVVPLGLSSTFTGGGTGPIFFDPVRTINMENFWGTFYNSSLTQDEAAAFQLAVWEIAFDDGLDLTDMTSKVYLDSSQASSQAAILNQAQGWLDTLSAGQGLQRTSLYLMTDDNLQDLITPGEFYPPVPEPASMLALAAGIGALAARRRRNRK